MQAGPAFIKLKELVDSTGGPNRRLFSDTEMRWLDDADPCLQSPEEEHESTLDNSINVGKALIEGGRIEDGISLLELLLQHVESTEGKRQESTVFVAQLLGRAYGLRKDNAKSYENWLFAARSSLFLYGDGGETTIFCHHQAGRALIRMERFCEALPFLKATFNAQFRLDGKSVRSGFVARDLAHCLSNLGLHQQALSHWKNAHAWLQLEPGRHADLIANVEKRMDWTKRQVFRLDRQRRKARCLNDLAGISGLTENDRLEILSADLTQHQAIAVIEYLNRSYLGEFAQRKPGNLRVARKKRGFQRATYEAMQAAAMGECHDVELEVAEHDGLTQTVLIGFNLDC